MEEGQETSLEKRLKQDIGLLRDKNFFSGIAINFLGNKIQEIIRKLPLAECSKIFYTVGQNSSTTEMCAIAEAGFTEIKELAGNLYTTAFGIRRRYAGPAKNLPHSQDEFPELEEVVSRSPENASDIRFKSYGRYHNDHDKELDRLKIISETYRAILDKFASHASEIALYATEIYNPKREEVSPYLPEDQIYCDMLKQNSMLVTTLNNWDAFKRTLKQMHALVSEVTDILFEKPSHEMNRISLADTIMSVSRIASLCYQKPALRHKEHGISLIVDRMEEDIEITANQAELKQALLIMLLDKIYILRVTNKGVVNIGYRKQDGNSVMIYVKDNGPKIPGDNPNIILERAENDTLNRKFNIAEVRRSVEENHPEIAVYNTEPTGVEFQLTLQISPTA